MKKLLSFILCLLIIIPHTTVSFLSYAAAYSSSQTKAEIDSVLSYKMKSEGVSSLSSLVGETLPSQAGVGAEWYALSLIQYNSSLDFSKYKAALEKYVSTGSGNPTEKEKYALLLAASGYSGSYITDVIENCTGGLGIMSYIFSLHLLNLGYKTKSVTKDSVISELLSLQLSDGGWAVSGNYGDVDTTAMTLQALSQNMSNKNVSTAVNKALSFLSARLNDNCEYSSYGAVNSESTSQTIIALSALSIDIVKDSRFIKGNKTLMDTLLSYKQSDGSFAHIKEKGSNAYATVQALMALVSYYRFLNNKGSFYKVNVNMSAHVTTAPQTTKAPKTTKAPQTTTKSSYGIGNIDVFGFLSSLTTEKTTSVTASVPTTEKTTATSADFVETVTVSTSEVTSSQETASVTFVTSTEQTTALTTVTESETTIISSETATVPVTLESTDTLSAIITEISLNESVFSEITTAESYTEDDGSSPSYIIIAAALIIVIGVSAVVIIKKRH